MLTNIQAVEEYSNCIEEVMHYIREHINERLDRETLASVAGFSIPHFHRVFTAHVGESTISYVRRLRLERAARKLRMGAVDITEVALAAGYDTHAAFGRAFKRQFGLSPSEFRPLSCSKATQILRKG